KSVDPPVQHGNDRVAVRHGQGTPGTKVVLHVHHDESRVGFRYDGLGHIRSSLPRLRTAALPGPRRRARGLPLSSSSIAAAYRPLAQPAGNERAAGRDGPALRLRPPESLFRSKRTSTLPYTTATSS